MLNLSPTKAYQPSEEYSSESERNREREELITSHLSKVKFLADRMAAKLPPSVERDDLYGAGVIGLVDAAERFDASRGVAFTTFAETRIRGAILDSLRSLDWASRSTRRRAKGVEAAYAEIEQQAGRAATEEEVAKHLNIPIQELHKLLQEISGLRVSNLDEREEESGLSLLDTVRGKNAAPDEEFEDLERRRLLARAIGNLPERERNVIALYYKDELTMKEIGSILDITESRVSQLRTQAIVRLRNRMRKRL
ncbi:MAG: FliA/WhiG family RNA polymerase sigma factor [Pyrinomonadaceae bacterium]|nr:FliA/WhiG family RNA polymerase sigma factor [Pyrinomonadaceae bacterium]